jgi:hypothetical protein
VPLNHHPSIEVFVVCGAYGNNTIIAIDCSLFALHRAFFSFFGQRECGELSASIKLTRALAFLVSLRRINSMKANALALDYDRVAINHPREPGDFIRVNGDRPKANKGRILK